MDQQIREVCLASGLCHGAKGGLLTLIKAAIRLFHLEMRRKVLHELLELFVESLDVRIMHMSVDSLEALSDLADQLAKAAAEDRVGGESRLAQGSWRAVDVDAYKLFEVEICGLPDQDESSSGRCDEDLQSIVGVLVDTNGPIQQAGVTKQDQLHRTRSQKLK